MKVTVDEIIAGDPEQLFALSQDYSRRLEWDTYLSEAYLLHDAKDVGIGVDAYCKGTSGAVLISRYITYNPPKVAAVRMVKGPGILESFSGSWNFRPLPEGYCRVIFTYSFKARPRVLSWLLEPIIASVYRRDMQRRLAAFKRWAESRANIATALSSTSNL